MYTYEKILNNPLEKMGVCVNAVYSHTWRKCGGNNSEITYDNAIAEWRVLNLQKKRSSMALALLSPSISSGWEDIRSLVQHRWVFSAIRNRNWYLCKAGTWKMECIYLNRKGFIDGHIRISWARMIRRKKMNGGDVSIKAGIEADRLHACITDWDTILKMR